MRIAGAFSLDKGVELICALDSSRIVRAQAISHALSRDSATDMKVRRQSFHICNLEVGVLAKISVSEIGETLRATVCDDLR
jgi:hypothetical protein